MTTPDIQPSVNLETLHAKVDHLIFTTELVSKRTDGFDDRIVKVENVSRDLRKTAQMLSTMMLRVQFMKLAPLILVGLLAGIFAGTAVAALRPPVVVAAGSTAPAPDPYPIKDP